MATYTATMFVSYNNSGNFSQTFGGVYTFTDNDNQSTTFTFDEAIYYNNIPGSFGGTTTIGGNLFVIFNYSSAGYKYLIGPPTPTSEIPAKYSTLQINTNTFPVCFLAGTMIATPGGESAVEDLAVGDLVLTADGREAPVRWVGVQTVVTLFAEPLRSFPVRIAAGALGDALPTRDLLVSPDHALMLDGLLVQAAALVNGTTIVRDTAMPERFTYFHVELDDHALILAEGIPAETFLDTVTRRRFDNFAEYEALYGDTGPVLAELPAPRIKSARQLPQALRARLAACAPALDARDGATAA